jgi:hypothetical protein
MSLQNRQNSNGLGNREPATGTWVRCMTKCIWSNATLRRNSKHIANIPIPICRSIAILCHCQVKQKPLVDVPDRASVKSISLSKALFLKYFPVLVDALHVNQDLNLNALCKSSVKIFGKNPLKLCRTHAKNWY